VRSPLRQRGCKDKPAKAEKNIAAHDSSGSLRKQPTDHQQRNMRGQAGLKRKRKRVGVSLVTVIGASLAPRSAADLGPLTIRRSKPQRAKPKRPLLAKMLMRWRGRPFLLVSWPEQPDLSRVRESRGGRWRHCHHHLHHHHQKRRLQRLFPQVNRHLTRADARLPKTKTDLGCSVSSALAHQNALGRCIPTACATILVPGTCRPRSLPCLGGCNWI